jgi:hypothetical protein
MLFAPNIQIIVHRSLISADSLSGGGEAFTGPTACIEGYICVVINKCAYLLL